MKEDPAGDAIRAKPRADCPICGAAGRVVDEGLRDRMGSAPGVWGHRLCGDAACGVLWLDPVPLPEDLPRAYRDYFTHGERPPRRVTLPGNLGRPRRAAATL